MIPGSSSNADRHQPWVGCCNTVHQIRWLLITIIISIQVCIKGRVKKLYLSVFPVPPVSPVSPVTPVSPVSSP